MTEIIVFIFILLFGFFANWRFKIGKLKSILKNLIAFIGAPILIIHSVLSQGRIEFGLVALIIIFSLIINIILSKIGNRIFNLKDRGCLLLLNSFANVGFLGLPLCWIVFGDQGIYYGSLYVVIGGLVHFFGIAMALREERTNWFSALKDSFKFPVFWTNLVILLILSLRINFSIEVMDTLGFIGKATLYLIMFYVGLNLSKPESFRKFYQQSLYVGVFRFLISPLVILIPSLIFNIEGRWVLTFQAMMPPAIFNIVVASFYRMNERLCSNITTILTILFLLGFILIKLIVSA